MVAALAMTATVSLCAQDSPSALADEVAGRIDALTRELRRFTGVPSESADEATIAHLTGEIRQEVTRLLQSDVLADTDVAAVAQALRTALRSHTPGLEHTDLPTVREFSQLRAGRALVVSYAVVRPPHFDSSRLFGFVARDGRFTQTDTAGAEFEGHTMFSRALGPADGEVACFVVGGQATTFNGARFRFRAYEFDGLAFRRLWAPPDVFDATLQARGREFTLSYRERPQGALRTARYVCTPGALRPVE